MNSNEVWKIVIQYVISPLVLTIVGILTALYRKDMKTLKESVEEEKVNRKEETGKLFNKLDGINKNLGDIKGRMIAQEKICNIRHGEFKEPA